MTISMIRRAALTAVLVSLPALAQGTQAGRPGQTTGSMELPLDERGLLERLHEDNQREIRLGKLATERGQAQSVKDFGDMMVRDHSQLDKDLMAYAQKKNIKLGKVTPVNEKERKHAAHLEATDAYLRTLDGAEFDAAYLSSMVADHDHGLNLITRGLQKFKTGDTAELLRQAQSRLQHHRDAAYRALGEIRMTEAPGVGGAGTDTGTQGHP